MAAKFARFLRVVRKITQGLTQIHGAGPGGA